MANDASNNASPWTQKSTIEAPYAIQFRKAWLTLVAIGLLVMLIGLWQQSNLLLLSAGGTIIAGLGAALLDSKVTGYRFTLWIVIANLAALLVPSWFQRVGSFSLTDSWLLLVVIQAIMFGMGTQMSFRDFANIAMMPKGVVVGLSCQFLIMPLLGFGLAMAFRFPPEIAAGVILIGSCSSGLASNVMTFLAKGNLALSVAITALATAMAPVITPLWMKILAGSLVEFDAVKMSLDIIKMVIVPILAAFVHDWLTGYGSRVRYGVLATAAVCFGWLLFLALGGWTWLIGAAGIPSAQSSNAAGFVALPGFLAAAVVFGTVYHFISERWEQVEGWMPIVSMFGIIYFTLVTTATGRDQLLEVGVLLVVATFLHNVLGYFLGYWGARMMGMNRKDSRTIAIEVGTQNGSMGVGIAKSMGKLETVGLAAMIFAPLMNVTGSILANYWRKTVRE